MDKKPLVSVCIPTYNGAHLVGRAIQSCLDQTYENLEVIVVDDSSRDDTVKVVKEFQKKSDKVKFFVNKENLGAALNFLETFRLANGFYVQHLGQDDWLDKNHIAEKVSVLNNHPDIAFVANCQNAYRLDKSGETILRKRFCKKHGYHFSEEVFKKFYREPGLIGFFCFMRKEDVMAQYLVDIPNNFDYGKYYRKAMVVDNLLLLRILNLKKYNGRYFYTNKTGYCNLERPDNYSRDYGWINEKKIADWVKFAHIDRVGYEFF
ncbi:MAG: glycosyltransferase family 2 protein, partial [Candidatus Wolfebacteria bacterium]|nr:glycosyltransferase family 2 protein [Candidatus Wolfebacteria bacterium]